MRLCHLERRCRLNPQRLKVTGSWPCPWKEATTEFGHTRWTRRHKYSTHLHYNSSIQKLQFQQPASHPEPRKTKQVTRERGDHLFSQKQQDHSMSQQGIYNLRTSSLLCTEMVDEARGEQQRRNVSEPEEEQQQQREGRIGEKQRWAVSRCFPWGLSYVDQSPWEWVVWTAGAPPPHTQKQHGGSLHLHVMRTQ